MKIKIKTIELPEFVEKDIQKVYDYLKKEYPNQLPFDGVDFYDNEILKDGKYHFFFGSLFRYSGGRWRVPCVDGGSSGFGRSGGWLGGSWGGGCRVVLLET